MQVQPYLMFEGQCEKAINFYKTALNAEVVMMMRFSDNPEPQSSAEGCGPDASKIPPESIMHASFRIGDTEVMASDGMSSGKPEFKGITLSLNPTSDAETKRMFAALSEGGKVNMPLSKTFYSPQFGMVTDQFGVSWMVNQAAEMPAKK
ncbi:MAG: VOC family metalloprotein YjdN [Pseudomonadota bacterium]